MVELNLDPGVACRASSDVVRIAGELHSARARVSGCVATLVTSGWSGVAAEQFAAGWDDWDAGAAELLRALETLGDLVTAARRAFERTDEATVGATGLLVSRLEGAR